MNQPSTIRPLRLVKPVRSGLILAVLVIGMAGVAAVGAGPVTARDASIPAFFVALESDGSATVTVTYTFDLTSEAEAEAFRSLQEDRTAREALRTRFSDRLQSVAQAAADRTGRSMAITDASIAIETANNGQSGIARLRATWVGLARTEGDQLMVTEPFASEFTPDRRFVLRAPDGYTISAATPAPAANDSNTLHWTSGATLDGFEVVMTADGSGTTTPSGDSSTRTDGQPGFGLLVAIAAIGLLVTGPVVGRRIR